MKEIAVTDSPADVVAYLERRRCDFCRAKLGPVTAAAISPSQHGPAWRCFPPHPTCWDLACPECGQQITIWVRKGKAGPLYPSLVSRRSPVRKNG